MRRSGLNRDTLGMAMSASSSRVLREDQQLGLKRSCPLGIDSLGAAPRRMKFNPSSKDELSQGMVKNSISFEDPTRSNSAIIQGPNKGTTANNINAESKHSLPNYNSGASDSSTSSRSKQIANSNSVAPSINGSIPSHTNGHVRECSPNLNSHQNGEDDIKASVEKATISRFNKISQNGKSEDFGVPFEHVIDYAVGFGLHRHAVLPAVEDMFKDEEKKDENVKNWRICQWARVVHEWCGKGQVYLEDDNGLVHSAKISRVDPSSMLSLASWYNTGGDKVLPISSPDWSRIWCSGPGIPGYELWQIECFGEMLGVVSVQRLDFETSKTVIQGLRLNPKYNPLVYKRHKGIRAPDKHFKGVATWLVFHVLYLSCLYGGDGVRAEIPKHPPLEEFYFTLFSDNEWNDSGHLCVSMEAQERWDVLKAGISHLLRLHQSYQRKVDL